ncbi:MAG: hypothetical protein ACTSUE_03680 [Promethearchaeota archaeon]
MSKSISIKARKHYGSKSLDLTIPVSISKKLGIKDGDVFILKVIEDPDDRKADLILEYKRVYAQNT